MPRTLDARHDAHRLSRPFRISRGVKTVADVVTVTIRDGDATGHGESVPYLRYGESVEATLAQIESVRTAVEARVDRDELARLLPAGAARNAVDCALWDLEARLAGTTVAVLAGIAPLPRTPSAITIVIDDLAAMTAAVRAVADAPVLKLKVDANDPAARLQAVRNAAPSATLIVDPNESWDRATLEAAMPMLIEARVAMLEQPVPASDDAWLGAFDSPVPICADEAIHTIADLDRVAALYGIVNVKLDKTGGLTGALALARAARARGLGVMTGCMVSSSLSIAPALHVAALSDYADLDGPLWLAEDYTDGVRDEAGYLLAPRRGFWGT